MEEAEPLVVGGGTPICTVVGGWSCPIGRSLSAMLLRSRDCSVRIADTHPSVSADDNDELDRAISDAISEGLAMYVHLDIRDGSQVLRAVEGSDVVFLMDLVQGKVVDLCSQYEIVIRGAKNVIRACRKSGVKRLIYNSSADVVFDGVHSIENGDESLPYPHKFADTLTDFKAQAEAMVLFANGMDGLLTCALRPCNPFGPRDAYLVNFLLGEAKAGREKYIVGSERPLCDFTHVDNVAHAHIMAEKALKSEGHSVAGKPLFISNLEPMKLLDFSTLILQGLGYQRPKIILPVQHILFIAMLIEWVQGKLRLRKIARSCFQPSVMRMFSCTRTFNCSQSQKFIGYSPMVPLKEGIKSTIESFSRSGNLSYLGDRDFMKPSKAEKLLGCSKIAEVLLWRNEKKTFTYLLSIFFLFQWFFLSSRTLVTSVAKLLVILIVILFVHGKLPSSICGFTLGKISSSHLTVSSSTVRDVVSSLASFWNEGINILRAIEQDADWSLFLRVLGYLLLFRLFCHFSLSTLVGLGIVFLFSFFIVYEQHEVEIDNSVSSAATYFLSSKDKLVKNLPLPVKDYIQRLL